MTFNRFTFKLRADPDAAAKFIDGKVLAWPPDINVGLCGSKFPVE